MPGPQLVGGPAGTMEGGRQAEVAKAILSAKNVPYVVAAPLLIQVPQQPQQILRVLMHRPEYPGHGTVI